jgi:hypothetical protein
MAALFCTGLRQDRMKELSGEGRRMSRLSGGFESDRPDYRFFRSE